jgi:signal transduction histidine kinase/DNA-binding response OmpR family regulator
MTNVEQRKSSASVLLVDDTPANLLVLNAVLKPLGARLVEAKSGIEALEAIRREPFAVVLLDVQMPDMDGFEVARRLRQMEHGREMPILFLTAIHRDEVYARRGYATGAADYITKPFDADVLRARVKAFVDLFQQREEVRQAQVALRTRERDEAVRRLVAFERIATAALDEDDLGGLLKKLLDIFLSAADAADSAMVLLREGDELKAHAVVGLNEEVDERFSVRIGEGFAGQIAAGRQPVEIVDASTSPDVGSHWLRARGTRGLYGVPLLYDGEMVGVAHIGSRASSRFSDAEKRLFSAMAERAAWAVARHVKRSRLHDVLSKAPALICIVGGPHLCYEFANPAYRALFGGRELVGMKVADTGVDRELIDKLSHVLRTGETVASNETAITADWRGDGERETRFFSFTMQPLRGRGDEGVLLFANDVTAHVRARRELEAHQAERAAVLERERIARAEAEMASRAKDQFLATVSHELRTPLNAILGWAVLARPQAPPQLERALAVIERNARAQARIIDDVLDISRIVSGKFRLDIGPTNLSEVIQSAIESVRPAAEARGVELSITIGDIGQMLGDPERLQQIVWNLLSNGIKFTPKGGKVALEASSSESNVSIRVRDNGQGIDPAFLPHLFEAFRQADGSTTRRHGGLGLGLAIVKQLVQAHGGTIEAESEGTGKGATFIVELPSRNVLEAPNSEGGHDSTPEGAAISAENVRLEGIRVLVVDDEEDARMLLKRVLEERGASVALAASSEQALEELPAFRPDVMVSDIGMPGTDGYSLIRSIRALPSEKGGRTPAIALTAYARVEDSQRAFAAGFQRHVAKPVDFGRLVSLIANLCGITLG